MSDGIKDWADEEDAKYFEENFKKDKLALEQLLESKNFKRLQELRKQFADLKEMIVLDGYIDIEIEKHRTSYGSHYELIQKLREGKIYF